MPVTPDTSDILPLSRLLAGASGWPETGYFALVSTADASEVRYTPRLTGEAPDGLDICGEAQGGRMRSRFRVAGGGRWVDESICMSLPEVADVRDLRAGPTFDADRMAGFTAHPVPFKVGMDGRDCSVRVSESDGFSGFAEGWIIENGRQGLLAMRVPDGSPDTCFVPLSISATDGKRILHVGSVGPDGDDHRTRNSFLPALERGEQVSFPRTRYAFYEGGWEEGVALFRSIVKEELSRCRQPYKPSPVTYNTYHDFGPKYDRAMLEQALPVIADLGVGLLHLDPGWETFWGSSVWNREAMGEAGDFVKLAGSFGLLVGCWTTLHLMGGDPGDDWYARDADGETFIAEDFGRDRLTGVCPLGAWRDGFVRNMRALVDAGFVFINSDFHDWPWEQQSCHAKGHRHTGPLTRPEWALALNEAFGAVHAGNPDLVIEMHDHVESGEYRTPVWYLYDRLDSYDEKWAYEFMWKTHEDLLAGRLFSLYHLRKAEPVPLFLHMNMRTDNANALAFWYVASCVNHIGVGGALKAAPEVFAGYKRAIALYNRHFDEFTRGEFVGIDETAHVHIHPDGDRAVLICFNLTDEELTRSVRARLPAGAGVIEQMDSPGSGADLEVTIPPKDIRLIPVRYRPGQE